MKLLYNEIQNEHKLITKIQFPDIEKLKEPTISISLLHSIANHFRNLKGHYKLIYNKYHKQKETLIKTATSTPQEAEKYYSLYHSNFNESLDDLVRKKYTKTPILIIDNHIIQVLDPIFMVSVPSNKFDIRTHFYASEKPFFGKYYDTFIFNIVFIWIFTVILFVILYFDFLNKLIQLFSIKIFKKKSIIS